MVDPVTPVAIVWIWWVGLGDTITPLPAPQYPSKALCLSAARREPHVVACMPRIVGG